MIKQISKNTIASLFFLLVAGLILWQMLLPGYILTLDMVFTPKIKVFLNEGDFYNNLPFKYLLLAVNYLLPGWVIQKIILLVLFFLLGFLAYYFLPLPKKYGAAYWAGLVFVINPFVYERFLAGHWQHLLALSFLPPLSHYLIKFYQATNLKNILLVVLWLFLISIFSLHLFVMATVVSVFYSIYQLIRNLIRKDKDSIKKIIFELTTGLIIFLIFSSYWLIPYLINHESSIVASFDQENWHAFRTAGDQRLKTSLNVLALYGYWGEREPWAKYFLWPKDNLTPWLIVFFAFSLIIGFGIYESFKVKKYDQAIFFLIAGAIGFIFSCGVGETIFKNFNIWLFNHVWFWPGFRDTQKWSSLLVLSYAYFGAFGFYGIISRIKETRIPAKYLATVLFMVPVLYTYTIWGGFSRQLKPVWYPQEWHRANEILNQESGDFKVLFLPWHQYLSLEFNQRIITQNPAKDFFDQEIVQGENMELGNIYSQGNSDMAKKVESILLKNDENSVDESIKLLFAERIKYMIISHDLAEFDNLIEFDPEKSLILEKIFTSKNLTIYKILL